MKMTRRVGEAGLQGWREKAADGVAGPIASRTALDEGQVRALIGTVFFALSVMYVVKTIRAAAQT